MQTKWWQGDQAADIAEAALCLRQGELSPSRPKRSMVWGPMRWMRQQRRKFMAAKGRPSDNPLIVHIYDKAQLEQLVSYVPPKAEALMAAFWPGPLTLVLPRAQAVPDCVTGGLATVGIRMPDHPAALALLKACGLPLAAPSANTSGKPSPTHAEHVYHDLSGRIAGIIDGGPTTVGLESTVLDVTIEPAGHPTAGRRQSGGHRARHWPCRGRYVASRRRGCAQGARHEIQALRTRSGGDHLPGHTGRDRRPAENGAC